MKWIAAFLSYGKLRFEPGEDFNLGKYSAKVREMLREYLEVTGIVTLIKLEELSDMKPIPIQKDPEDISKAAIRRGSELTKVLNEKVAENPLRYEKFSARVKEVLHNLEQRQIDAAEAISDLNEVLEDVRGEERAYRSSGLNERAYGVYRLLQEFTKEEEEPAEIENRGESHPDETELMNWLKVLAQDIDQLYSSNDEAPVGWHLKSQLKKELRQKVRAMAYEAGLKKPELLMPLPHKVQEFALRFYVKVN